MKYTKISSGTMEQGMLAWDLVRVLSIVGGAYMGGIMEYKEAVKIAWNTELIESDIYEEFVVEE